MKVKNLTPFLHAAKVTSRQPPQPEMVLVVRGCFSVVPDGPLEVATGAFEGDLRAQGHLSTESFHEDDVEMVGAPLCPNDFADLKLNGEVLLQGSCHAPGGEQIRECPVKLGVGAWSKTLKVTGQRSWSDSLSGAKMSKAVAFTKMPLDYNHAFGGAGYEENPQGKGHGNSELPNVESPAELIHSRSDRPRLPAGFGPINPSWPQRLRKRGKRYDGDYLKKRAPFYAEDLDWSYFHSAPMDQQLEGYLRGDEPLEFLNLHPDHATLKCQLPGLRIRAFFKDDSGSVREIPMLLDTVLAKLDDNNLLLTWRGLATVGQDDLADVQTVLIASEPLAEPRQQEHYHQALQAFEDDPLGLTEMARELYGEEGDPLAKLTALQTGLEQAAAQPGGDVSEALLDGLAGLMPKGSPSLAEAKTAMDQLEQTRQQHMPEQPSFKEAMAAQMREKRDSYSPLPLFMPLPGEPVPAPPIPEIAEALKTADEALARGTADLPTERLEALERLRSDPRMLALRPADPIEPGPGKDLSRQDLRERDLSGRDLRNTNLSAALLTRANLQGALLGGANLAHAVLYGADLSGADLSGTNLELANLSHAKAQQAIFRDARLKYTFVDQADLHGADFSGCRAEIVFANGTTLTKTLFVGAELERVFWSELNLEGADFSKANFLRSMLLSCKLTGSCFDGALLNQTGFFSSEARKASFVACRGLRVSFQKVVLDKSDLSYAVLPSGYFSEASAVGARFFGANLKEARFYRCNLSRADLSHCNLYQADIRKANLDHAKLTNASLFEAILVDSAGRSCDFSGANLKRCKLPKS